MGWRIGIDSGGTFCDLVAYNDESHEERITKFSSNPDFPIESLIEVIKQVGLLTDQIELVVHGTTVLTNYLIEERGPDVAFITNKGFKDIIFIQNGNRQFLYDLQWKKSYPLVKRRNCYELDCRIDSHGDVIKEISKKEVIELIKDARKRKIKDFAVCFLFSFLSPQHELLVEKIFKQEYPEAIVALSHRVYRRWKEYDRASTTIADSYLRRFFSNYVTELISTFNKKKICSPIFIMKSNSGVMRAESAWENPTHVIMSGPVAGILGARFLGNLAKSAPISAITMDMGGTSCDVCLIDNNNVSMQSEYEIKWGIPIKVPMVAIHSIGAGGGSIAWIDSGKLLRVGPRSAGANPGPVCYMQGGIEPTLTDANLVLKRLNPEYFCQGKIKLNTEKALSAISDLAKKIDMDADHAAEAIIRIACNNSANAIRVVSIAKGVNPADFILVGFGGAGGLHTSEIAYLLGMKKAMIPRNPGHVSALGLLTANLRVDNWSTLVMRSDHLNITKINTVLEDLKTDSLTSLKAEGSADFIEISQKLEMRYFGQNYHKEIPLKTVNKITETDMQQAFIDFHDSHKQAYGYANVADLIEIVGVTVTVSSSRKDIQIPKVTKCQSRPISKIRSVYFDSNYGWLSTKIIQRDSLEINKIIEGPAIIEEPFSTSLMWPHDTFFRDEWGNIVINVGILK